MASAPALVPFHSAIPRYHQIAQVLRQRACGGGPGFTEQALCAEFGVSRTTVRQALELLKREGVLKSRRGVGTQLVGTPRPQQTYTRSSGDPLHAALGTRPRLLAFARTQAPAAVQKFLGVESVLRIERLHELHGEPISLVVSYLPGHLAGRITRAALRDKPLNEVLWQRARLLQKTSTHTIRVAHADGEIASRLAIAITDPVLYILSRARLDDGRPIRWTDNYFREDRYEYTAEMTWKRPK